MKSYLGRARATAISHRWHTTGLAKHARRFGREEDGVLVGFGVFLILMMLMVGGLGVDIMRFELTRSNLQHTLDRAVLAAADLDQELDAEDVVHDYFYKSDLSGYLTSVTVDQGLNYKEVSATAEMEMRTQLIHMMGIDSLRAPAAGAAAESVDGVEISLVLDISGSMSSNNRMNNLRPAAKEFVNTMLDSSPEGEVSISIVPYATQVNIGPILAQHFNLTDEHDYSHCVDFNASDFSTTSVSTSDSLQRTGPFDPWYTVEENLRLPVCSENLNAEILAYSMNHGTMEDYIDDLGVNGNTSIDIGVKWGAALLDPSMNPVVNDMIADGDVDPTFTHLPTSYDEDVLKVLVVMSDGENTAQYYLNDDYEDGQTDVWYYEGNVGGYYRRIYSIRIGSTYYYKQASGNRAYWFSPYYGDEPIGGSDAQRLTFPQLFHQASNRYIAFELYDGIWSSSYANSYWRSYAYSYVGNNTKDSRTDAICQAAKDEGAIIFTIGFEAPWRGRQVLKSCASSDGHYFDVDGIEISDAFASIASSISKLRLIQ
ncbi:TadE/TadG family type IV pilus assembly protein [Aquicoccus sp.]|uniref:TadE/TadG family type IV pilus assembly protein n=1 Tax=Aquicoccus sp. TaxID=2055851 RepID=UPI0035675607